MRQPFLSFRSQGWTAADCLSSRLPSQSRACRGERQPGRSCFQTVRVASAKVGIDSARRFSARGSPPSRASFRFANAFSRASLSETRGKPPSPSSVRRPRMVRRWIQPSPGCPWAARQDRGLGRRSSVWPGSRCGRRPAEGRVKWRHAIYHFGGYKDGTNMSRFRPLYFDGTFR